MFQIPDVLSLKSTVLKTWPKSNNVTSIFFFQAMEQVNNQFLEQKYMYLILHSINMHLMTLSRVFNHCLLQFLLPTTVVILLNTFDFIDKYNWFWSW